MTPAVTYASPVSSATLTERVTCYAATYEGMAPNGHPWCSYAERLGRRVDRITLTLPLPSLPMLPVVRQSVDLRMDGGPRSRRGVITLSSSILAWLGADATGDREQVYLTPIHIAYPEVL